MRCLLPVAALAVALVVLGCGGDGDNPTVAQGAGVYKLAKKVCANESADHLARDLGIQVNTKTSEGVHRVAEKYAKGFGQLRQAAFEGCLDALEAP
jgi:hypothetical protein